MAQKLSEEGFSTSNLLVPTTSSNFQWLGGWAGWAGSKAWEKAFFSDSTFLLRTPSSNWYGVGWLESFGEGLSNFQLYFIILIPSSTFFGMG